MGLIDAELPIKPPNVIRIAICPQVGGFIDDVLSALRNAPDVSR
jgi:hypothetical protein